MTVKHCDGRVAAAANLVLIRLFDCVPRTCSTARFQEVHSHHTGVSPPTFLSFLEFRNSKANSGTDDFNEKLARFAHGSSEPCLA